MRIIVLLVGWLVVLVGIAGLPLPGPGTVIIALGAAILSVGSELAYEWIHKSLHRWPSILDRVERFRGRLHARLHKLARRP